MIIEDQLFKELFKSYSKNFPKVKISCKQLRIKTKKIFTKNEKFLMRKKILFGTVYKRLKLFKLALVVQRISSSERDAAARDQILSMAVYISHYAYTLGKSIHPSIFPPT